MIGEFPLAKLGNLVLKVLDRGTRGNLDSFDFRNVNPDYRDHTLRYCAETAYEVYEGFRRMEQRIRWNNPELFTPEITSSIKNFIETIKSISDLTQIMENYRRSDDTITVEELNIDFPTKADRLIEIIEMIDDELRNESNESNELTIVDALRILGFRFGYGPFRMRSRIVRRSVKRSRKAKKSVKRSRKTKRSVKRSRKAKKSVKFSMKTKKSVKRSRKAKKSVKRSPKRSRKVKKSIRRSRR